MSCRRAHLTDPLTKSSDGCARRKMMKKLAGLFVLCVLGLMTARTLKAQDQDTTRKLWDTAFIETGKQKSQPRKSIAKRSYRVATPNIPPVNVAGDTPVGITVWRL